MAMRLSEIHPSLVHFPIALLPVAIGADAVGKMTGNRELHSVGKIGIGLAAASAAIAGVFGFIAQEEANIDDRAKPILQTHRTLNILALVGVTTLAIRRAAVKRPGIGYLLAGLGAIATVSVSAYFGGKLVYTHGAAVEKANGIYGPDPTLLPKNAAKAVTTAAKDLGSGVAHTARDMANGELVPALR